MKTYKEVSAILVDTYAQSQLNAYMGGSNQYEVSLSAAANVLAITFGRNYELTVKSLEQQVQVKFNMLLKEQTHRHPERFILVDGA